jgi:hypothetical protein
MHSESADDSTTIIDESRDWGALFVTQTFDGVEARGFTRGPDSKQ